MELTTDDYEHIIYALKWQINTRLDDFPLSGDHISMIERHIDEYVIDDIDTIIGMLRTYKKLLLIRRQRQE